MFNKYILSLIVLLSAFGSAIAQSHENLPIFKYGTDTVYGDEFLRVFNKNKTKTEKPSKEEIEDYLELYTKFKIKVKEAYALKMDTVPSFVRELDGYRKTLAQPYLRDKKVTEMLVKEAYDRSLQEVRASHILISCPVNAKAHDTLIAYKKALEIRDKITVKNESFAKVAKEFSEDPSAQSNEGDLGYFTAFQMIYPFENAAYNTPIGEVSQPVRTRFGYHILNVVDKRPAKGDVKVAHIMIRLNKEAESDSGKRRIDAIYEKVKAGEDWNRLTKEFSEDFSSKENGGEVAVFNRATPNVPFEFKDVAYTLKNTGAISEPFRTQYGWHIVKKLEERNLPSMAEAEANIKRKIERDSRSELNREVVLARIREENNFQDLGKLDAILKNFDEQLLNGQWAKTDKDKNLPIFKIGKNTYFAGDFYDYAFANQSRGAENLESTVEELYANYKDYENLVYEEKQLETKYEDFRNIVQEYKDGILLFELTDQQVWSKAVKDSVGLKLFYEDNKENYKWGERINYTLYSVQNPTIAKKVKKLAKKGTPISKISEKYNKADALAVTMTTLTGESGKDSLLKSLPRAKGLYDLPNDGSRVKFVTVNEVIPISYKTLEENLGQITSDYQTKLERDWINSLREKYPISVFENNLKLLY